MDNNCIVLRQMESDLREGDSNVRVCLAHAQGEAAIEFAAENFSDGHITSLDLRALVSASVHRALVCMELANQLADLERASEEVSH